MAGPFRLSVPGFHKIPARAYHADPAPEPSLSHSVAKVLLRRSPAHARIMHPRLCAAPVMREPSVAMEEGTVLHELILGDGSGFVEVMANDWRAATDRRRRAEAREAGVVPVLSWRLGELQECADSVRQQIAEHPECEGFFDDEADSEVTMLWQAGPVWCRALADRLHPFRHRIFDLKSTGISAEPAAFGERIIREYATQSAWYQFGADTIDHDDEEAWSFRFIAFETGPPYCLSVHELDRDVVEFARHQMMLATRTWAECLMTGEWPGYSKRLHAPAMSSYAAGRAADTLIQWSEGSALS